MIVRKYKNLKEAIEDMTKKDKECVFVRHSLKAGKEIKSHYHKKANEFVIADNGNFKIKLEGKEREFNLKNKVIVIKFPKGKIHSLFAVTPVSYFVIRDVQDRSIFK